MSRVVKIVLSDAVAEALDEVALKDNQTTDGKPKVQPFIRTAIGKLLHRRGYSDEQLRRKDGGHDHKWIETTSSDNMRKGVRWFACDGCGERRKEESAYAKTYKDSKRLPEEDR